MINYELRQIDKSVAKKMIVKNHYSHCWTMCHVALGVFEIGKPSPFIDDTEDTLIGVLVYGAPVGRQVINGLSPILDHGQVLELTRLWIKDGTPKNTESYCIAQSFDWLKKNRPEIKVLVSYADPEAGHLGRIYQATNWLFQKVNCEGDTFVSLDSPPDCKWIHPRTLVSQYGCRKMEHLKKVLPKPYWIKLMRQKFRYLYVLTGKIEKKRIVKSLCHPTIPYPKEINGGNDIIEITSDVQADLYEDRFVDSGQEDDIDND
jgi:hypothetical protein